jgi:hypothetical protein
MALADLITEVLEELITVSQQRDALVAVFQGIPGITTVYGRIPKGLERHELPALVLFPGESQQDRDQYATSLRVRRSWTARLYVKKWEEGTEFDPELDTEPFVDTLPIALAAYPRVLLEDGRAFALAPTGGTTVTALPFRNEVYAGVAQRFQTTVEATIPRLGG